MVIFPRAKINIGLRITEKREDGYHNIETLFYPVGLCDALEFVTADNKDNKDLLTVTGIDTGSDLKDNLVMKAINKLRESYRFPYLEIHLHKAIPAGAGLGGGSSDAAFILKGVNRCYGLKIDDLKLKSLALELGSDCPFFIDCKPAFATGRGEILIPNGQPLFKNHHIQLFNPGIGISTRESYQNCHPEKSSDNIFGLWEIPLSKWKDRVLNDFEDYAIAKHAGIGMIKEELYRSGALFSSMSGSGSSVYGIFESRSAVPDKLKDYLIWQGVL